LQEKSEHDQSGQQVEKLEKGIKSNDFMFLFDELLSFIKLNEQETVRRSDELLTKDNQFDSQVLEQLKNENKYEEGMVPEVKSTPFLSKDQERSNEDSFWNDLESFMSNIDGRQGQVEHVLEKEIEVESQDLAILFDELPEYVDENKDSICIVTSVHAFKQQNDKAHLDLMQSHELDENMFLGIIEVFCSNINDRLVSYEPAACNQPIQIKEAGIPPFHSCEPTLPHQIEIEIEGETFLEEDNLIDTEMGHSNQQDEESAIHEQEASKERVRFINSNGCPIKHLARVKPNKVLSVMFAPKEMIETRNNRFNLPICLRTAASMIKIMK